MNSGNMGRSSKDAQGDERSAQIKRLKSINSNIKNAEVNVKQSEVPRPKVAATQKQQQQQQQQQQLSQPKPKAIVLPKTGDSAKLSKLRIPTKAKAAVITELPTNRITQTSNKSEKKNTLLVDNTKKTTMKVQTPDNTDLICQTKKKDVGKSKNKNDENQITIEQQKDNQQQQQQQETTNGKTIENEKKCTNVVEIIKEVQIINEIQLEKEEKEETNGISDSKKNNGIVPENGEKNDKNIDKIITDDDKLNNDELNKKNIKDDINDDDMISLIDIPEDNIETTKSDEIVGSTTSESSPKKNDDNNKIQNNNELIIPQIKINQDEPMTNDDPSFISYDSAIMLKDVKIKLNDCLKDNNKLMDSVDENTSISESFKDLSFGRTLRTISGRSSLGRMKHVTIRQRQMTPNDSLFVNCSGMSTNQDEQLRFASEFSDSLTSGTSIDRKRKIDTDIEPSAKKIKKDETGGIFNTSLEYLKKLRRPLQVSTPNNQECKYNIDDKLDITEDASKIEIDETAESKRWCILM